MQTTDLLESAVAEHLRATTRGPDSRERPEFDSYTARLDEGITQVVMAYFGAQEVDSSLPIGLQDINTLLGCMDGPGGPAHSEISRYRDEAGYATVLVAGYWLDPLEFDTWFASNGTQWTSGEPPIGHFTEIVRPSVRRLETLARVRRPPVPQGDRVRSA